MENLFTKKTKTTIFILLTVIAQFYFIVIPGILLVDKIFNIVSLVIGVINIVFLWVYFKSNYTKNPNNDFILYGRCDDPQTELDYCPPVKRRRKNKLNP
jgi:hypothetical protein